MILKNIPYHLMVELKSIPILPAHPPTRLLAYIDSEPHSHSTDTEDTGYLHDGRADKDSYQHDICADKDSYPHDRHADKNP